MVGEVSVIDDALKNENANRGTEEADEHNVVEAWRLSQQHSKREPFAALAPGSCTARVRHAQSDGCWPDSILD